MSQCGDNIINASRGLRNELCQKIYKGLLEHNKLNLNILHTYIKVCTENGFKLDIHEVLSHIKDKQIEETYKLLLRNVCENGDLEEVIKILNEMKNASVPNDEYVFNNLILAHSITG